MRQIPETYTEIGYFGRTRGVKGMLDLCLTVDISEDYEPDFLFVKRDGCYIPYEIEKIEYPGNADYSIKLCSVDTKEDAEKFTKQTVYIGEDDADEVVEETVGMYEGYKVKDSDNNFIGTIIYIDDSTVNVLFGIETEKGDEILVPAVDEYIIMIDDNQKVIQMNIPEGLLDINSSSEESEEKDC